MSGTDEAGTAIPAAVVAYIAERDDWRGREVRRRWAALSPRERRLVREAAVMGYVQGVRAVPGSFDVKIRPDREIVSMVIDACSSFPELYPTIYRAGSRRREPEPPSTAPRPPPTGAHPPSAPR